MTAAFDNRLMKFNIQLDGREYEFDQNYYILATGTRYSNGNFGECAIKLDNIAKATRDFIISKTTPWAKNRSNIKATLSVGRESYGMFELFKGDMVAASITQPPDIGLIFRAAVGSSLLGYANAFSAPPSSSLRFICQKVADNLTAANPDSPTILDFQSTQGAKTIGNFSFSGPVTNQIRKLQELASINAFVENGKLVVLDIGKERKTPVIKINKDTGMIGVPEITEYGVRVRSLILNNVLLGSPVEVISELNPQANGTFYVFKLQFEVASRDTPFYWVMELRPPETTVGVP